MGLLSWLRRGAVSKPMVRLYPSDEALQAERDAMRAKGLFLASVSDVAGGGVRAVWVAGRHHEVKQP